VDDDPKTRVSECRERFFFSINRSRSSPVLCKCLMVCLTAISMHPPFVDSIHANQFSQLVPHQTTPRSPLLNSGSISLSESVIDPRKYKHILWFASLTRFHCCNVRDTYAPASIERLNCDICVSSVTCNFHKTQVCWLRC